MSTSLFCSLYLAPISYYKSLLSNDDVVIEQYNNYERKTYQNRCEVLSANGIIALSVPVEKGVQRKTPFADIKIAYHTDWQKQHLRALMSAYQNSPFYDYYIDDFLPLYERHYEFLIDFNMALHQTILEAIGEARSFVLTEAFGQSDNFNDLRFAFVPRCRKNFDIEPYIQVFSDKVGFEPNLSILDLLFNLGPETELYLKRGDSVVPIL